MGWWIILWCPAAGIGKYMPYGWAEVPPAVCVLGMLNGGGVPEWKLCFSYDCKENVQ